MMADKVVSDSNKSGLKSQLHSWSTAINDKIASLDVQIESRSPSTAESNGRNTSLSTWQKIGKVFIYVPPRCRYDPSAGPSFSWSLNILFAAAGCFTVANLYYTHPILNLLARDFGVTYQQASYIPTMAQAGYALGLFVLNPAGDLLRRRPYILCLIFITALLWIGLCITPSYSTFLALTFITGITTVTPQLMLPLVGELAPPHRRATALSIVVSGLLLGLLVARLLSGVVTLYIGWRYVYWISFTLQSTILILLYLFMPDYPSTNPQKRWLTTLKLYPLILFDTIRLFFMHPVLTQACLIGLFSGAAFTSFWTTLTFLLSSPPYEYTSLIIGLFALVGIAAMTLIPPFARLFMDHHVPLLSVIIAMTINLTGAIIGTFLGKHHVAGPIIQAATTEIGLQTAQVGNRTGIYAVEPKKRNRVNTVYMLGVFGGQLMGTGVGNAVYAKGGWVRSGVVEVVFIGCALALCFVRGPHERGWMGWSGGWRTKRDGGKECPADEEKKSEGDGSAPSDLNEAETRVDGETRVETTEK